jgi:gamma-glutamyl-gamma-aminobutyrate hydrolase PuuD
VPAVTDGAAVPRIGLTTYVEHARWRVWNENAALLPTAYVEMVASAGGLPVLLPPIVPGDARVAADAAVAGVDGLVLTGGADVDPGHYGAEAHLETDPPSVDRDGWELALLAAALDADLPVLAVCRGAQLLNVARGGTLHQHLPEVLGHDDHRPVPGTYGRVHVQVDGGTRLAAIVGDSPEVHCHHHQAIDRLGDGLAVCARADDGTIEGVELTGGRFALGVQWHPEAARDERLFIALARAAAVGSP